MEEKIIILLRAGSLRERIFKVEKRKINMESISYGRNVNNAVHYTVENIFGLIDVAELRLQSWTNSVLLDTADKRSGSTKFMRFKYFSLDHTL